MKLFTPNRFFVRNFIFNLSLVFVLLLSVGKGWGQVAVTNPGNTTPAMSPTYSSLALAIADVNSRTSISGPVTLTLSTSQTAPVGGYSLTNTSITGASDINRFIFDGGGNTITAPTPQTSGSLNDAIFKIIGADFITIQNFVLQENVANTATTAASNNMTEFGVALFYSSTTNGAQNNLIQNNTISLNRAYQNSFGIFASSRTSATLLTTAADATSAAGANSNNKIYSNNISNVNYAIVFLGSSTIAGMDTGNDIGGSISATGNTISNFCTSSTTAPSGYVNLTGSNYAIFLNHNLNSNVSYNTITSASSALTNTLGGILQNFSVTTALGTTVASTILNNNTVTLSRSAAGTIIGVNNQGLTTSGSASTIAMNNNQILNVSITVTGTSAVTGVTNLSVAGILNMNGNIIRGITSAASAGAITGVSNSGAVITSINMDNNKCGDATAGFATFSAANSGSIALVSNTAGANTCTLSIQNNDIRGLVYSALSTAPHTYLTQSAAVASANIAGNTFTNLSINTSGAVIFISHNYAIPSTGQLIINNNSIVTAFTRLAAGSITISTSNSTSGTGSVNNYTNNNFSNIIVPDNASSTILGFNNTDGGTGSTKTITGNIFNNWHGGTSGTTGTTGSINCMNFTYWNGVSSLSNNNITNITGRSSITGVTLGSASNAATSIAISGNSINNLMSIGAGGQVLAISCSNTSTTININGNIINNLSSTAASSAVGGISVFGASTTNVYQNVINDLSTSGGTAPIALGIQVAGGTLVNIYRNKIYNISASGSVLTSANSAVSGIYLNGGTTVNTFNNLIGNLTSPNAALSDAIRGINVISVTAPSSYNIYNNTIYITGSGGTNFGSSGIYHAASSTSTTAALNLQNNMVFNTCTPNGTGVVTAYRRSAGATLGNYASTSNKNLFYAGTPSATATIMSDGTNNYQTISSFQAAVSTREANSFSESTFDPATYFVSTTGSNANFLQPANGLNTQAESGGNTIAMCSPDYNGVVRPANNGTGYDIGAWEFAGVSPAPVFTNLSPSPALTTQCSATARVINIDITTTSGTITGATLNYSHNGTAQNAITMINSTGNTWTGTMNAPTTVNATVSWSITATNSLGISTSYSGTSFSDAPNTGITATSTSTPAIVCDGSPTSLFLNLSLSGNAIVGNNLGTAISTTGTPYRTGSTLGNQIRSQYLILASELQTAGISAGNINSIGINVSTAAPTGTMTSFSIGMANVSVSALTSTILTNTLTSVFSVPSYSPIAGMNTHVFSNSFVWDGTSNLLIDIRGVLGTAGSGTTLITSTTPSGIIATVQANSSTGFTDATGTTITNQRPQFTFNANIAPTPSSFSWSNGTSTIGTTNPLNNVVVSGTTIYTCTATVNNCPMTASVTPTVNPLPTAPTATNSTQCGNGIPTASVSDNNSYSTPTFKWYSASTGGTLLQTNISTTYLTAINTTTTFYVAVVNPTTGCESARTAVTVTVNQPDAISASTSASTICIGQSVTLTAANTASSPTQNYSYSWVCTTTGSGATTANSSNPASVTPTSAGSFTYTVTGTDGGCTVTNTVAVTVNPLSFAGTAAALNNAICQSAGTTINLTGSTGTIQWQSSSDNLSFSNINGQTSTSLNTGNLSNTIYYKAIITSGVCNSVTSNTVTITVNNPQVLTTSAGSICSTLGSVALSGTSSAGSTLNWYANSIGGASLAAASSFNTPNISSNTNFYVASEQLIGSSSNVGPLNYSIGTSATSNSATAYLVFSVLNVSTRLLSVDIFPSATVGSAFAISIQNSSGIEIFNTGQLQTTVASGQIQTVPIGFDLAVGTGYRILCSTNPTLYRNSAGYTYPYTNGNISITGANNSNYHFFYNWSFVSANQYCSSSRSTVLATVSTPPSITTSASASTLCSGSTTTLNATSSTNSGYSYLWSNGLGAGASVTASPTSTTTYSVTATDNSGGAYNGCTTTATLSITVNPVPSAISLSPSSTQNLCLGNIQSIVVNGGLFNSIVNVGTSTTANSSTSYPAPYTNYYGGAKHQMLIRASELLALGLVNGSQISTIGFNVTSVGSTFTGSLSNFQIDMGHTTSTVLGSTTFISGLTNVLPSGTVSIPTTGLPTTKTHTLTTPFTWNGTDNLVIQTSFSNANSGTSTDFVTMTQSDPGFVSTNWYRVDGLTASAVLSSTTPTSSGNARPNIILGATIPQQVTFSPTTDLYTNAGATTAYTGNPSTVYSKPTANRTYTATATTAAGCSTTASVTINVAAPTTQSVASTDYIWKGTTSTAWGTTTNWTQFDGTNYTTPSAAPTTTSVVVIPQNNACVQNQPLIGSSAISVQDLKIESGATTTLNSGAQLTISGTLTNNGTLTLESGATLVQGSASTLAGSGTYNVKQTITGAGSTTPSGRFWYLGSPVSLASSSAYFASNAANVVKKRSESTNAWTALSSGSPENLVVGQGYYTQAIPASSTINFTGGLLNNGAITINNLTRTAGQGFEGFNLVSNPYPSYLDWDAVTKSNVDATMWYRTYDGTNMVFETYVAGAAGGVGTNVSGNTATRYIPPMQSYWVRVSQGQTSGSLALDNTMRSHFASLGSSTAGLRSTQDEPSLFLRMNLLQANKKDQLIVYVNEQATNGFDMLDGEKMMQAGYPQFYTKAGDKKIVINGLNSAKKQQALPVTIELPTTGVHSFVIEDLEISNGLVWLEDRQEEVIQPIEAGTVYEFYANAGLNAERFVLHFQLIDDAVPTNVYNEVGSYANFSGKGANVHAEAAGVVVIKLPASTEGVTDIQIRDAAGKLVYEGSMNNLETSVQLAQANGIYYVTLSSSTGVEVRKVFIQQ